MKKILFGLLALSSLVVAKEVVPAPAKAVEAPVAYAPHVATPAPYLNLRFGGDIAPRYKEASLDYNSDFFLADFLNRNPSILGKSLNDKKADGFGFEVAAEYMYPIKQVKGLELGLGIAFQRHGKISSIDNSYTKTLNEILEGNDLPTIPEVGDVSIGDEVYLRVDSEREIPGFDSLPLYVIGKYSFENVNYYGWRPYVKADLGWSYNMERGETRSKSSLTIGSTGPTIEEGEFTFPELVGDGYAKIENGLYWGAGFGAENDNWTIDLMYKVNTAKAKGGFRIPDLGDDSLVSTFSEKIDYSRVTLSVGYKF